MIKQRDVDNNELTELYCCNCKGITAHSDVDDDELLDEVLKRNDESYRKSVLLSVVLMDSWSSVCGVGRHKCSVCGSSEGKS
ncbi:hypothetical protein [Vibrio owensii]|uniref:hypothetical protein n=1 Tax=Vibrio owensii TaxID=696485 RepID=UPI0018F23F0F|nr:hypothetical protein [Vibrio owensii]